MIDIHKEKCKQLMKIRKIMADKLGVDLHQRECTFEGKCSGTCPKCKQEEEILNKAILQRTVAAGVVTTMGVSMVGCSINNKDDVSLNNSISTNTIEEQHQVIETTTNTPEKPIVTHIQDETKNVKNENSSITVDNYIDVQSIFNTTDGNSNVTSIPTNTPTNTTIPTIVEKPTNEPINTNIPTPTSILVPTNTPKPTNAPTAGPTNTPSVTSTPTPTTKPTTKPTEILTPTPTPIATVTPIVIPDPTGNVIGDDNDDNDENNGGNVDIGELTGLVVVEPTPTPDPDDLVIPDPTGNVVPAPIAPGLTGNVVSIPTPTKLPFAPLTGNIQLNP